MKIALYSSTDIDKLNEFANIAKKYAKNGIVNITNHYKWVDEENYINFQVDSLEFLPKLEQDLDSLSNAFYMLIFSTFDDGTYGINIYNGMLE